MNVEPFLVELDRFSAGLADALARAVDEGRVDVVEQTLVVVRELQAHCVMMEYECEWLIARA